MNTLFDLIPGPRKLPMTSLALIFLLAICSCSDRKTVFDRHGSQSQNAVDSVVQPDNDMRKKTQRSQEAPSRFDEMESEEKGDISNDNTA